MRNSKLPVVVGVSGASGAALAERTIARLGEAGYPVVATCTPAGQRVWREELGEPFETFAERLAGRGGLEVLDDQDLGASIASGRRLTLGMIVVPCSMGTLAAIAGGRSTNLLQRAADVTVKEGRPLVLVPRESPFSAIHLENMLRAQAAGAVIFPVIPSFYHRPKTIDDLVTQFCCRVLSLLGLEQEDQFHWEGRR